jgi:DNA-binding HxlR family transcriptional regulator
MAAFDLLGRRWTMRVLWELRDGPVGFRELRARCDAMSSSVLRTRLVELMDAGLVRQDEAYELTELGRALGVAIEPMLRWAERWGRATRRSAPRDH